MSKIELTYSELLSTLKRTNIPTVVVEGKDDSGIYTLFQSNYDEYNFSFIKAGCRNMVLNLSKASELKCKKIVFLIDQDIDLINKKTNKIKKTGNNIVTTNGYSIENDILMGSKDIIKKFLSKEENEEINKKLNDLAIWFSSEVAKGSPELDKHVNITIFNMDNENNPSKFSLCEKGNTIFCEVQKDIHRYVRGKTIFQVYQHYTNKPKRIPRYNKSQLIDICINVNLSNHYIEKIFTEIQSLLN